MTFSKAFFFFAGLAGATLVNAAAPPPSIGVSPSRLEVTVSGQTTMGSATVLNLSDRPIHVKSNVVSFDLDESNSFRELAPEPGDLAMAMMINPVDFTIPANGSQTVRFAITPQRLDGEGEHRAMLFFSELVDTSQPGVKLNFRLGMPIYATLGETTAAAQFNNMEFDAEHHQIELDVSSTGTAQVLPKGYYLWWPATDFPSEPRAFKRVADLAQDNNGKPPAGTSGGRIAGKPIFAGTRRSISANIAPPPGDGEYMLVVQVNAGDEQLQQAIRYGPTQGLGIDSD